METNTKVRQASVDYLRIISAFAVVVLHVTSASLTYYSSATKAMTVAMQLSTCLMTWAVPTFLLITGYLWLADSKRCTYKTVGKYIGKFVAVLMTIGLFYAMLELVFNTHMLNFGMVLTALGNVFSGKLWDHMWYVYAVIGVYLMLPLIKPFFEKGTDKDITILVLLAFLWRIVLPYLEEIMAFSFPVKFGISNWVFYAVLGGWIAKHKTRLQERKKGVRFFAVLLIVCGAAAISIKYFISPSFHAVGYQSLSVCLIATAVVLLMACANENTKENKFVTETANCCWGIYLIHPFFINLMIKLLHINPLNYVWGISVPATCVLLFAASAGCVWLCRKMKLVRKFIF